MAERRPSFPFYPKDWLSSASVSSMPLAAQGLYVRLMAYAWQADGLPCSDEALRNLVGVSRAEWRKLWPHVAPMWREENGRLFNRKLEQVRVESAAFSEAARIAGRASAAARAQRNGNGSTNGTPTEAATKVQPAFAVASSTASSTASTYTPRAVVDRDYGHTPAQRRTLMPWESAIGVDVTPKLHREFSAKLANAGVDDVDGALHAWYRETEAVYHGKDIGEDAHDFWRARFKEWRGTTAKAAIAPVVDYTPSKYRNGGAA